MCFEKHPYQSLRTSIKHENEEHIYYDISQLDPQLFCKYSSRRKKTRYFIAFFSSFVAQLPFCMRVLLESTVRHCDSRSIGNQHVEQILNWKANRLPTSELPFQPSQVIMHDFS